MERDAQAQHFEKLKAQVDAERGDAPITIESFTEDWNESQFWVKLSPNPLYPPGTQTRYSNRNHRSGSTARPDPAAVMWLDAR